MINFEEIYNFANKEELNGGFNKAIDSDSFVFLMAKFNYILEKQKFKALNRETISKLKYYIVGELRKYSNNMHYLEFYEQDKFLNKYIYNNIILNGRNFADWMVEFGIN